MSIDEYTNVLEVTSGLSLENHRDCSVYRVEGTGGVDDIWKLKII